MKLKLIVEYDGRGFCGWQRQAGVLTVQEELERAFGLLASSWAKRAGGEWELPFTVIGSGRTDSGVHARAQVANVVWPDGVPMELGRLKKALNGVTVPELSVLSLEPAEADFDARSMVRLKQYSYRLSLRDTLPALDRGRVWRVGALPNLAEMLVASRMLVGKHSFAGFRAGDCAAKTTTRTLHVSELSRLEGDELIYTVQGNGFLKQMVRIIVGTLVTIGWGRADSTLITELLDGGDRTRAGRTAPPDGLYLDWVRYDPPSSRR